MGCSSGVAVQQALVQRAVGIAAVDSGRTVVVVVLQRAKHDIPQGDAYKTRIHNRHNHRQGLHAKKVSAAAVEQPLVGEGGLHSAGRGEADRKSADDARDAVNRAARLRFPEVDKL